MDLGLKGRTALITGGSRGIGYGVARLLAAEGCHLHLASRTAADLDAARRKLTDAHDVTVTCHALDLASSENVRKLAEACRDVDILVNNAGAIPQGTVTGLEEKTWREAWDLKVFGFVNLVRELYRTMCDAPQRRHIVVHWHRRRAAFCNHCRQHGQRELRRADAGSGRRQSDYGVRVVGVNPGATETDRQVVQSWRARAERIRAGSGGVSCQRLSLRPAQAGGRGRQHDRLSLLGALVLYDSARSSPSTAARPGASTYAARFQRRSGMRAGGRVWG